MCSKSETFHFLEQLSQKSTNFDNSWYRILKRFDMCDYEFDHNSGQTSPHYLVKCKAFSPYLRYVVAPKWMVVKQPMIMINFWYHFDHGQN